MVLASIDIGTNTVLLLVASVADDGSITTLAYEQRIPRLGRGVDRDRRLQLESMARVREVLEEYRRILDQFHPEGVVVCGTSAVRDASNREEFGALVQGAGFDLQILSGEEEALWTYRGALSGIPGIGRTTVIDIGGGSTEITLGDATSIAWHTSLNIGSVRLTERFFHHDPPLDSEIERCRGFIRKNLATLDRSSLVGSRCVAVAGTATSLAMLSQEAKDFDIRAVTNYEMSAVQVRELFSKLRRLSTEQILALSPVMSGRADVITAGALILLEVMAASGVSSLVVSERGVRYGLVLREWERQRR